MIPDWVDTIWSIEIMSLGLVFKGLLIKLPECLPLVLHGLLWDFPNNQATQGGGYDISELLCYYPHLGCSEEGFERAMVQPVVPNQELPLVLYQKVLS